MSQVVRNIDQTDYLLIENGPGIDGPAGSVLYVSGARNAYYDREAAVTLIEAVTNAVVAADAKEAAEEALYKRGEIVYGRAWGKFLVLNDQEAGGRIDVAVLDPEGTGFRAQGDILDYNQCSIRRTPPVRDEF